VSKTSNQADSKHRATLLKADGTQVELDHRPSLMEAQQLVGGYIEFATCPDKRILVVDEEGLLKRKPYNEQATRLYGYSPIAGDAILLTGWRTVG
jgi:hypothetical protein